MRQVEKHLYVRGKNTTFYARISVPKPLRAQLKKNEFTRFCRVSGKGAC